MCVCVCVCVVLYVTHVVHVFVCVWMCMCIVCICRIVNMNSLQDLALTLSLTKSPPPTPLKKKNQLERYDKIFCLLTPGADYVLCLDNKERNSNHRHACHLTGLWTWPSCETLVSYIVAHIAPSNLFCSKWYMIQTSLCLPLAQICPVFGQ